ncbi:conserved hypothetical protein [Psychromonas ingrahamii 37]|uniref:Uncharacterized protein n=1 Tax=Psychromonas ingrahamii (strain DSM 17664 / CCUG 51855 / 37) TaxID=357804 RepID=A1SSI3_PSYIN|nr:hypothetical protein [Psychromonas ingrahamii]ABM02448.1 conserved hypothetical protein [Psychromonas ingrahamii 37]
MNNEFNVEILSFLKISEIENAWTADDYKALLSMIDMGEDELGGMSESELKEMCLMSLNDLEAHESAKLLLAHIFKDEITAGKIDQISHQMLEKNLWEVHADPAYHMSLFNAYELLRKAYNGTFTEPTGVKFTIKISADKKESFDIFDGSLHAVIVRLLANGLKKSAILNRLFEEKIIGESFPEAKNILWILKELSTTDNERQYEITSSYLWFGELEDVTPFDADAHADREEEDQETK